MDDPSSTALLDELPERQQIALEKPNLSDPPDKNIKNIFEYLFKLVDHSAFLPDDYRPYTILLMQSINSFRNLFKPPINNFVCSIQRIEIDAADNQITEIDFRSSSKAQRASFCQNMIKHQLQAALYDCRRLFYEKIPTTSIANSNALYLILHTNSYFDYLSDPTEKNIEQIEQWMARDLKTIHTPAESIEKIFAINQFANREIS